MPVPASKETFQRELPRPRSSSATRSMVSMSVAFWSTPDPPPKRRAPTSVNGPGDCLRGPADDFASQMANEQEVAAATGVRAINPEQWFCWEGRCPTFVSNTPVYPDGQHMTAEYSERIAPFVVSAILQP